MIHLRFACVALISVLASGCIKSQQTLTLMPDGSGKMEISVGFNTKAGQQLNGGLGGPPPGQVGGGLGQKMMTDLDPLKLESVGEGFVAFTKPEKLEVRGWEIITFTAYFDDINKVKMNNNKERITSFQLTKQGAGAELTIEKPMLQGMQNDKPRQLGGNNMPPGNA